MGILKNHSDLRALRQAGRITHEVLDALVDALAPGLSTVELETLANRLLARNRSTAPFKNFDGFNHAICVSINEEIVNGPPSRERILKAGDLVKIATAAEHRGIHAKAARTACVGDPSAAIAGLIVATASVIPAAQARFSCVSTLNELLSVVPETAARHGLTVIKGMGGFGIGRKLHEPPLVPNEPQALLETVPLVPGLAFTLMPMLSLGTEAEFDTHEDGWTYVIRDGAPISHVADTLLVSEDGLVNITSPV